MLHNKQSQSLAEKYLPEGFKMGNVKAENIDLQYVANQFSMVKPNIVLIHGWPQSWYAFRKMMPLLKDDFKVIAINLPGIGGSQGALNDYDTQSISNYFRDALNNLKID